MENDSVFMSLDRKMVRKMKALRAVLASRTAGGIGQ